MRGKVLAALAATMLSVGAGAGIAAAAGEGGSGPDRSEQVKMRMAVSAERFAIQDGRAYARGPATLTTLGGESSYRSQQRVALKLRKAGKCKVLDLHLEELFVALLGLEVTTGEINLQITGDERKALGRLFCQLSRGLNVGKQRLARKAVHSLNQRLADRPLHLVRIRATLHPQTLEPARRAPGDGGPRCQILDVDIGPLRLDLLGLVVDLYGPTKRDPVHVDADADPNGGTVGAALCELSAGPAAA